MKYAVNPSASIQQQSHPGNVATPATMLRSPPFTQSPPLRCFSLIFAAASQLKYSLQRAPYFAPPLLPFQPVSQFALSHPAEAARSLGPDFCHYRCHEGQCTRSLLQFRGSISPKSLPCLSSWPPPSPLLRLLPVVLFALLLLAQARWCVLLSQIKRNHCCCTSRTCNPASEWIFFMWQLVP